MNKKFDKNQLGLVQLELNKSYVDGLGYTVKIVEYVEDSYKYNFIGDNCHRYMADGRYVPKSDDDMPVAVFGLLEEAKCNKCEL
jgi:hypothetical protein